MAAQPTSEAPPATRDMQLRLFFSVDLVNGTDFKNRRPPEYDLSDGARGSWTYRFGRFFTEFSREFDDAVRDERIRVGATDILERPRLWKINGDELLFTELVYPDKRHRYSALATSIRAFVALIAKYDADLVTDSMGVRGCVWTAGFPIRNRAIRIYQEPGIPIIRMHKEPPSKDFDTGDFLPPPPETMDYIGRDMDLGFRLAAVTPPGRIACSLDVAELLTHAAEPSHVFLLGWRRLKGIGDGQPYPLLWLDNTTTPADRHPWDRSDEKTPAEVKRLLTEPQEALLTPERLQELAERLRRLMPKHLIRAYASPNDIHPDHRRLHARGAAPKILEVETGTVVEAAARDATAASPSSVPTITMDDLNQLQIVLTTQPQQAALLADVLRTIGAHEAYRSWEAERQFDGRLFRMPVGLVFPDDERRRLLETLRLVLNDVLRVKINLNGESLFLTDGLWVPGEFRVFPFGDESELLRRMCAQLGWDGWPTCLVDPATGCGHNLLLHRGRPLRRFGFDLNARAISYASINAALNRVETTWLGLNDVRHDLPSVFEQGRPERLLAIVNMPFALVPETDTLPRSADGGRYGYKLTLEALNRIHGLTSALSADSELRALVLTYTVGSVHDDRWAVPEHAKQLFGADAVTWRLLEDERLWRVRGKKEQPNPMPFDRLELKADCPFYVRSDAGRAELREGYQALSEELRGHGWDHLAYGIVAIETVGRA